MPSADKKSVKKVVLAYSGGLYASVNTLHYKQPPALEHADMVYNGLWSLRDATDAAFEKVSEATTGEVKPR